MWSVIWPSRAVWYGLIINDAFIDRWSNLIEETTDMIFEFISWIGLVSKDPRLKICPPKEVTGDWMVKSCRSINLPRLKIHRFGNSFISKFNITVLLEPELIKIQLFQITPWTHLTITCKILKLSEVITLFLIHMRIFQAPSLESENFGSSSRWNWVLSIKRIFSSERWSISYRFTKHLTHFGRREWN